jgi:hypothetical protein
MPIDVLDVTYEPSHLNTALNCELSSCLHFPTSSQTTPRTELCIDAVLSFDEERKRDKLEDYEKRYVGSEVNFEFD